MKQRGGMVICANICIGDSPVASCGRTSGCYGSSRIDSNTHDFGIGGISQCNRLPTASDCTSCSCSALCAGIRVSNRKGTISGLARSENGDAIHCRYHNQRCSHENLWQQSL